MTLTRSPTRRTQPAHILVIPYEAWGHVRPLLHLTIQLLTLHPNLHVSLLLSPSVAPRVSKELASSAHAHTRTAKGTILDRLQQIQVKTNDAKDNAGAEGGNIAQDMGGKAAAYGGALAGYMVALYGDRLGEGVGLENKFREIRPTCIIYDMFQSFVPEVVRETAAQLNGKMGDLALFGYFPCGPTATYHHFARDEDGGFLDKLNQTITEAEEKGEDPIPIIAPTPLGDRGILKKLPGLPEMTDFELHPGAGASPCPPELAIGIAKTHNAAWAPNQTGILATNVCEMELEAKEVLEEYMGRPFISLGFQYSEEIWNGEIAPPAEGDADGVATMAFLDIMLERRGERSVIFVSFGSTWFPVARPDIVHNLLDTLLSTSTPFVFAYATELFDVPQDLIDKVKDAEFGLAVKIAPQVQVLNHPAVGFFVSHAGANSLAESVLAGVPLVTIGFAADQGEHAAILKKYNAGIDLKQVKCFDGPGTPPKVLYDGTEFLGTEEAMKEEMVEMWAALKGDLGKGLYQGMAALRELCYKSCHEGGASRQAMLDLAEYW